MEKPEPQNFEPIFFTDGNRLGKAHPIKNELSNLKAGLRELYHNIDLLIDAFSQRCESEKKPVHCHMGCHWCCNQAVFASTHEMIVLVDYLKKHYAKDRMEAVKEKAKEKEKRLSPLKPSEALKTSHPCPLLHKGRCMVYPVRPTACRIYLSSSKDSCIAKYERPKDPKAVPALFDFPLKAGRRLNQGFAQALREQGLIIEENRIEHILLKLLESPQKTNDWLEGAAIHDRFPFDEISTI
ncbi:YkgJ family cysteine cluster protein [Thermophagus sp. OGC60D27]|uniref:YkgJ family cysteine cluster protein n=1 Tax=Thermophagus sp. OGC60D27 TaxID=3458415 RepID=UPI004037A6EA